MLSSQSSGQAVSLRRKSIEQELNVADLLAVDVLAFEASCGAPSVGLQVCVVVKKNLGLGHHKESD